MKKANGTYSRYADDLAFSGDRKFARNWPDLKLTILSILLDEGFPICVRKTQEMFSSQRQQLTGFVVNQHLHRPRSEFDELKACLFNCVRYGPISQNRVGHQNFRAHLAGRIAFLRQFHPKRAEKLQQLMDQIEW
ncbi:MAG: hypothetical protein FJ267_04305 [Planctomycetes bacterium]|nr:hypothetical protein [Planctomycetota bacterium]